MSTHLDPDRPARPAPTERGPERFLQAAPTESRPSRVSSIGSALLLLGLVVGVPVALIALGGVPELPTSLPTREQLTGTLGAAQLLSVLVWVVWLAWLQFTVCVAVEFRSALRGVGLPTRVPLAGPSQRAARVLVASVLLLVTAAGQATAAVAPSVAEHLATPTAVTSTAVAGQVSEPAPQAVAPVEQTAAVGEVTYHLGDMVLSAEEGAELVGKRVYVVQPPDGRYHDNLWDIAERTTGDGRRYQEIYELNKGRDQPDGHELSLARLIYPNWLLVMPEDAVGVERVTAVTAPAPQVAPAPAPVAPTMPAPATAEASTATESATATLDERRGGVDLGGLLGAGLLAAGLVVAVDQLRRRRRTPEPSEAAVEAEVALRVGADPERATRLDGALRTLGATLREAGRDLPPVYAAVVDDAALTLHLAPAVADAPAPWVAEQDGARWVLSGRDRAPVPRQAVAPFPGLVSLGRDSSGADVLVDLEAAQGPISVVGDSVVAAEVVAAIAAELATNRWSDDVRVTGVDLPGGLTALGPRRYRSVRTASDVLPALAERQVDLIGGDVLSGRLRRAGESGWVPEYVVLGTPPDPATVDHLLRLTGTTLRAPLGVVCAGDLPGARWRLEVDSAGSLTVDLLDVSVRANRLTPALAAAVAELLTEEPPAVVDPARVARNEEQVARPVPPVVLRPVEPADLAGAPVRVRVLGTPLVTAPHPLDAERVSLCTELVVHLALQPEGVHPTVLGAALWPRGVTAAVRDATIERARDWLGTDRSGVPHLRKREDGKLVLGPDVVLDWDVVCTLAARSRTRTSEAEERRDLMAALRLVQGGVLARRPPGRYAWIARVRVERAARDLLVDAAHRLAVICSHDDDPAGARAAAWAGLAVAPTEEVLWRDVLRAAFATGGADEVRSVAAEMEMTLHSAGVTEIGAPTVALLEELAPGPLDSRLQGSA
ncbi:LysM peptidoglycan-binding domain-containing protein [Cellulomonas fengjieae]|uniref:LysM peptidoglycan-binding domain-containing protein n=1 Tax=Cellulomonas fengjieae TaxID=2819978 RepID=UPI001AAE26C2|nr:hypothetical protein [Cellulomonas fengjieae]MBO3102628.1 hypothetical protein [Cellulomonas fengjieae]